jgi:hypothetical protein
MLIILTLYLVLVWLVFSKLKLLSWGWVSSTIAALIGTAIPQGAGEGQIAVSGTLTRAGSIRGAKTYPALISIPKDIDHSQLRLGMPGTATVFADNAGVIGLLMSILVWISSYTAFL